MAYDPDKQRAKVKILYPEANDALIDLELEFAKGAINERRGYIPTEEVPLETRWYDLQVRLAVASLAKQGAEGEKSHSDNGVSRTYENGGSYPDSLLNQIIPLGTSYKS